VPSTHPEVVVPNDPVATAEGNAAGKAAEVVRRGAAARNDLVLAVDTIVVVEEEILGKAADANEARAYVQLLAGRSHDVVSGLCLRRGERERVGHCVTTVTFRPLRDAVIDAYVATGEWRERAGAYAIQGYGSALVSTVHGDYFNVVGLPVALLAGTLDEFGQSAFAWQGAAPR
jgi:septum formation protein